VIVITGIHHSFHAIEAGLLGNPAIGVNFLLPIWAMANVAQGGMSGRVVQNQRRKNKGHYLTVGIFCNAWDHRGGDFRY
jgi:phosphotransferase system  glucose/maltose/N-acetylglucosamine-specific IIC component